MKTIYAYCAVLASMVREGEGEDPVLAAVKDLGETVGKRLDDVEGQIEAVKNDYRTDHEELVKQVRKDAKDGGTIDIERLTPAVEEIIERQKAFNVRNRLLSPAEERQLAVPDPWDPAFNLAMFKGETADPANLLDQDVKAMESGDRKNARKGFEAALSMKPTSDLHKRVGRMATNVMIADQIARGQHMLNRSLGDYKGIAGIYPGIAKAWAKYQKAFYEEMGAKAAGDLMDTTDMSNWVPTAVSSEIRELIMLELRVSALFETIPMPRSPFQLSVDLTDNEPIYMAETTALPASYFLDQNLEKFTPSNVTFTARKLRGRMMASGELDEDAVVAIMPRMREKIVKEQADGREICIIDGQRTADIDTGGGGLAATNCRKAVDGLRYIVNTTYSANYCDGATFDLDILLRELRSKLTNSGGIAEYGANPQDVKLLPSIAAYLKMLTLTDGTNMVVTTVDKFGPQATIHRGQLGAIGGQAIIPSRHIRQDLNASGIYDATTTTKTIVIAVNPKGFSLGDMREVTVEASRIPHLDVFELVSFQRFDFQDWFGANNKFAAIAYNITSA